MSFRFSEFRFSDVFRNICVSSLIFHLFKEDNAFPPIIVTIDDELQYDINGKYMRAKKHLRE